MSPPAPAWRAHRTTRLCFAHAADASPPPSGANPTFVARERDLFRQLLDLGREADVGRFLDAAVALLVEIVGAERGYLELVDPCSPSGPVWRARGSSDEEIAGARETLSRPRSDGSGEAEAPTATTWDIDAIMEHLDGLAARLLPSRHRAPRADGAADVHAETQPVIERDHLFPDPGRAPRDGVSFQKATRRFQAALVQKALEDTGWNVTETAGRLGLTRSHVYNLMHAFGLERR